LKISIITVSYNSRSTIADTIFSVAGQAYPDKEHIVIDGGSTDGTFEKVLKNRDKLSKIISEEDRGIYDAMNKGVRLADGDIIGFLNSDDIYADNRVLAKVVLRMERDNLDAVFGDLVYVAPRNADRIVRYYSSKNFSPRQIAFGRMPAHPTLFFHKRVYEKYGLFKIDYQIAGDFEYVARVFGSGAIRFEYIPEVLVKMRTGGTSTRSLRSNWILNKEILRACRENGIKTNIFMVSLKYPMKIYGLFTKPGYEG
jgi:glycosyltransferase involved in cell wall biosynthesis